MVPVRYGIGDIRRYKRFKKIRRLIIILIVVIAAAATVLPMYAAADVSSTSGETSQPKKAKKKSWKLALNGGLTINSGNTESRVFNGGTRFEITLKKFSYKGAFEAFYGSSKGETIKDKGKWVNQFTFKLAKRLNAYAKVNLEYDVIADLALQTTTGLGIQYVLADSAKTKARIGGVLNGEFTDAFVIKENVENMGLEIDAALEHTFSKTAKFAIETSVRSNFRQFTEDYKIDVNASVSVMMLSPLWIKVIVEDKYVNIPLQEDLKRNDFALVTALEVTF